MQNSGFVTVELVSRKLLAPEVYLLRFSLPKSFKGSGLVTGECICIKFTDHYIRFYSVVSPVKEKYVEVIFKDKRGKRKSPASDFLVKGSLGMKLKMRNAGGFHYLPNKYKHLGIIVGGTGFSAGYQIIQQKLKDKKDKTQISMLFGAANLDYLYYFKELEKISADDNGIKIQFTLDKQPVKEMLEKYKLKSWDYNIGYVNEKLINQKLPKAEKGILILLCGPFGMINAMKRIFEKTGHSNNYFSYM